jgi:transcriptional regulator with XRE-family HTH domain
MSNSWQDKARAFMRRHGITQDSIAYRLGKSKGTVSNWFSSRHLPSLKDLDELAKILGFTLAELLSEDDSLARNQHELDMLRALRDVPEDQRDHAVALISAVLSTTRHHAT